MGRQEDGGGVGGPEAYLVPLLQLDDYQLILKTQEIVLKIDRINTTKEKEGATLKKVENVKIWFRGETDPGCCEGEGSMVAEKGERESTLENARGEYFPIAIGLDNERG